MASTPTRPPSLQATTAEQPVQRTQRQVTGGKPPTTANSCSCTYILCNGHAYEWLEPPGQYNLFQD